MQFIEVDAGDHRIYAAAILRGSGGFAAAVAVLRRLPCGDRREVFRDDDLGQGYPWPSAREALRFALQRGHDIVMCGTGGAP